MMVTVRKATAGDAVALARLRLLSESRVHDQAFVDAFSAWFSDHQSTHVPFLAEVDDEPVGMAWLMLAERVPGGPMSPRWCGDVQTVFVMPHLRNSGIGAALLDAVLAEAGTLGLEHVTVHANDRAMSFYERAGFETDRCWLRWAPERVTV